MKSELDIRSLVDKNSYVFIDEAGDEGECRGEVKHGEHEHAPHEPFQLVRLGTVGLQHRPHLETIDVD